MTMGLTPVNNSNGANGIINGVDGSHTNGVNGTHTTGANGSQTNGVNGNHTNGVEGNANGANGTKGHAPDVSGKAFSAANADLDYDVLIVGAGLSGIFSLHRMRQLGLRAMVLEAGSGEGGTWFW